MIIGFVSGALSVVVIIILSWICYRKRGGKDVNSNKALPGQIHTVVSLTNISMESPTQEYREDSEELYIEQPGTNVTNGENISNNEQSGNELNASSEATESPNDIVNHGDVIDTDRGPEDQPLVVKKLSDNPNFIDTME